MKCKFPREYNTLRIIFNLKNKGILRVGFWRFGVGIWEGGGVWILVVDFSDDFLDEFGGGAKKRGWD